jgi:hypothetical protein
MISTQVQRTLVKSPPELWAELSDPATLARHLGEFGEIRITRIEPEEKVEWTADDTSGTVLIKPSGWGTRVTLTVSRDVPESPQTPAPQPDPSPPAALAPQQPAPLAQRPIDLPQPLALLEDNAPREESRSHEPAPETEARLDREDQLDAVADVDDVGPVEELAPVHEVPEVQDETGRAPRRSFFARVARIRHRLKSREPWVFEPLDEPDAQPADAAEMQLAAPPAPSSPTIEPPSGPPELEVPPAAQAPEPAAQPIDARDAAAGPDAKVATAAESSPAEEVATAVEAAAASAGTPAEAEEAVLTAVLDRLGAAHHRPFSRA